MSIKIGSEQKLYMMLLGCKPKARHTEQHDIFFAVGPSLKILVPQIKNFWPDGQHNLHIDAWREVSFVDGYKISIAKNSEQPNELSLFFINLGGYQKDVFDELHFKLIIVAQDAAEAIRKAKSEVFFKTNGFKGATSHIDDKYDVDDILNINDMLSDKEFGIRIRKLTNDAENDTVQDLIHLGYFKLNALKD